MEYKFIQRGRADLQVQKEARHTERERKRGGKKTPKKNAFAYAK